MISNNKNHLLHNTNKNRSLLSARLSVRSIVNLAFAPYHLESYISSLNMNMINSKNIKSIKSLRLYFQNLSPHDLHILG
jgi:hypothetical protein